MRKRIDLELKNYTQNIYRYPLVLTYFFFFLILQIIYGEGQTLLNFKTGHMVTPKDKHTVDKSTTKNL